MSLPVIMLGSGGHAKVLQDILQLCNITILGCTVSDADVGQVNKNGLIVLGNDQEILKYANNEVYLINAVGSTSSTHRRKEIYKQFTKLGYTFLSLIHPSVILSSDIVLKEGVQLMAGSIIQPGSCIGENTIINTRAAIDHDCTIGDHVHIAPGVVMSGNVTIQDGAHIGVGSTIIQGITVGENCLVGAGSLVIRNVNNNTTAYGVPAKEVVKHE